MENFDDVTALRRVENQLRSLNAELEARVREETQAREKAQGRLVQAEKLGALGQLAGGVAHDFNNILQAVSGGAFMIRRNADDPAKVKRFADMVEEAGRRVGSVTLRLLAFARRGDLRAAPLDGGNAPSFAGSAGAYDGRLGHRELTRRRAFRPFWQTGASWRPCFSISRPMRATPFPAMGRLPFRQARKRLPPIIR